MNKLTKAAIAGAAGIALLLGGAGSLAYWNSSADIANTQIESGTLSIQPSGTGSWSSQPDLWVPGDTFTYTDTLTISATGDNLHARLSINPSSITGDAALKSALQVTLTATGTGISATATPSVYEVTPNAGSISVSVTVVVTFPSSITGTTAQGENVSLDDLSFKLEQYV